MSAPTVESLTRLLVAAEQECTACRQQLRIAQATISTQTDTLTLIQQLCHDHPVISQLQKLTQQEVTLLAKSTLTHILALLRTSSPSFS